MGDRHLSAAVLEKLCHLHRCGTQNDATGFFTVLQMGEIPAKFPAAHSIKNHLEWDGILTVKYKLVTY